MSAFLSQLGAASTVRDDTTPGLTPVTVQATSSPETEELRARVARLESMLTHVTAQRDSARNEVRGLEAATAASDAAAAAAAAAASDELSEKLRVAEQINQTLESQISAEKAAVKAAQDALSASLETIHELKGRASEAEQRVERLELAERRAAELQKENSAVRARQLELAARAADLELQLSGLAEPAAARAAGLAPLATVAKTILALGKSVVGADPNAVLSVDAAVTAISAAVGTLSSEDLAAAGFGSVAELAEAFIPKKKRGGLGRLWMQYLMDST